MLKTVSNKIIVKEPIEEKTTASGIIIQDKSSRNSSLKVSVVCVGPDTKKVSEGDTIIISPHTGFKFTFENDNYRIFSEDEVWAIL